jgi:diguanylate cyclase (GGDEF)-like protein
VVFSLVLVVAIVVGYLGRRSEVAEVRDERLERAAAVGAARVDALVDAASVAALSANSPDAAVAAVRRTYPSASACAVAAGISVCEGPLAADVADLEPADEGRPGLIATDDAVWITATGPGVALAVGSPVDVWTGEVSEGIDVFATSIEPRDGVGVMSEHAGVRETSAASLAAAGTYVVARTDAALHLPEDEERFYLVVSGLAILLLVLASTTLFVEQRSLRERATFDALTHLPNRSEFERRATEILAASERQDAPVCLLLFDLNGFKKVNDTYGHHVGDELLRVVGRRLDRSVRDGDLVARWGGDEFVALMPGIGTEEMGVRRAREIAEAVGGRTRIDGVSEALRVHVSVGVALWPAHADGFDSLLEAADDAMYRAKREGAVSAIARAPQPDSGLLAAVPARPDTF